MVFTPDASSGILKVRQQSPVWKSPLPNLPSWPILLGLLLIFSAIAIFTTTLIYHDGMYSPLNKSPRHQYQALHDAYLHSATEFFSGWSHGRDQDLNSSDHSGAPAAYDIGRDASSVSTAVVVMASKRRVPYVQIWAWSLVTGSSAKDLNQTFVTIVNTQRPSFTNSEDLKPLRDAGIPVIDMYAADSSEAEAGERKQWSDWILDEYLCHIQALRACDLAGVLWCIVFEEDSLLTRDLLGKFRRHVVEGLETKADIGMVKLFTTDAWSGYQWPGWPRDLLLIPGILAAALTAPFCYFITWINSTVCKKRRGNASVLPSSTLPKRKLSFLKVALIFGAVFGTIVVIAEVMSRQRVIAMLDFPGIHIDTCTNAASAVAVAFPIEITRKLREHLEWTIRSRGMEQLKPIDLEVFAWAENLELSVLQTSPSLAQHIGMFSSNPAKQHVKYLSQDSRFTFLNEENFLIRDFSRLLPAW